MPVKNIIPGQKVNKEKLQRDPLRPYRAPPPNTTIKTLNPYSDFTLSYLGEAGGGRNDEVVMNASRSTVVGKIKEQVYQ